jgi:8-oxo-dGTP pyrophosphatase MutT (NUDIX family)
LRKEFSSGGVLFKKTRRGNAVALICRGGGAIWCLPKGLVEKGEKAQETALREVQEETGLRGHLMGKLGDISYRYTSKEEKILVFKKVSFYLIRYASGSTRDHDFEVDAARWFLIDKALDILTYPSEREILKKAAQALAR